MSNILELKKVNKSFNDFNFENVSFSLPEGYIMGFIGPNGSGKTTAIKLIMNMLRRDSGEITVFNRNNTDAELYIKENIAYVCDENYFLDDWKTRDIDRAMGLFYSKWDKSTFQKYLDKFEISAKIRIKEMSKGMKMKVMLASALSHEARLLLLDEPTSGLDPAMRMELLDILHEFIQDGKNSVLFSTHIVTDIEKAADLITFIYKGKIIFSETRESIGERFYIIRGGNDELTSEIKRFSRGIRQHKYGFEALLEIRDKNDLPQQFICESASIEDIMVYYQGGKIYE